jgi:hypothetical protein
MNSLAASASLQQAIPTMSAPTPDQAQILEIAMANLKEPGEKPKEYWAFVSIPLTGTSTILTVPL